MKKQTIFLFIIMIVLILITATVSPAWGQTRHADGSMVYRSLYIFDTSRTMWERIAVPDSLKDSVTIVLPDSLPTEETTYLKATAVGSTVTLSYDAKPRKRHFIFTLKNPAGLYYHSDGTVDSLICLIDSLEDAITITRLRITCGADPDTEIVGYLMCAKSSFITDTGTVVIDSINTTSGTHSEGFPIPRPIVSRGYCMYIAFTSKPSNAIKQINFDITYVDYP